MLGLDHPFFDPLWRRIAVVAFCLGWALLEASRDEMLWAVMFGSLGLIAAWQFFVQRSPSDKNGDEE